ncbi:putative ribonuclease H-like domain-containing protein [Tanacetum coccineum]|uniref:Ribonuclease H-like domain-containing protein n=1 Tax=Tanacetum coccineum TaxID=301880 RepID=A0ABQ5EPL1_9ASTR
MTTAGTRVVVKTGKGKIDTDLKNSRWVWRPKGNYLDHVSKDSGSFMLKKVEAIQRSLLQDHAVVKVVALAIDYKKAYLSDYEITMKALRLLEVIPKEVKIIGSSHKRKDDVYSLDLKNIVPSGGITCLYANATADESKLWHGRLGHVNFKNIKKLVKGHLVRGLPSKVLVNDHTCVACKKVKQHKASCKAKLERIIRKPLELLHMDLFGPVSVESINKKMYYLVVTDDFSKFSWVFFLATKDETSEILCKFIICLENQLNHNVKIIRCDNKTKFKNHVMNELCAKKGIKREFSVARTPLQNELFIVSVENQVNVDAGTQDSYVAGSSGKDKEPTQEYILLPLHPHRTRIPVEDVAPAAHEKPSESSPKDNDV